MHALVDVEEAIAELEATEEERWRTKHKL